MTTTLEDYLHRIYPMLCKTPIKPTIFYETTTKNIYFEIADNKGLGICSLAQGDAYFYNPKCLNVYIINFERYINNFKPNTVAGKGKKCDFILASAEDCSFIVLTELTRSDKKYVAKKGETALEQFRDSIEKLSKDENFLKQFQKHIALYSCRLSSTSSPSSSPAVQGIARFNKPTLLIANISQTKVLTQDFRFEQRIYPNPYTL